MDTGCCGMAGTFGYEAEHYDLSMRVGGLKLFPQLTPSQPPPNSQLNRKSSNKERSPNLGEVSCSDGGGGVVVSTGAACRMQIRQGTGVNAVHPVVLVANAIKADSDWNHLSYNSSAPSQFLREEELEKSPEVDEPKR